MKCSPKDTMAVMDGVEDKGASGKLKGYQEFVKGGGLHFSSFPGGGSAPVGVRKLPGNCIEFASPVVV